MTINIFTKQIIKIGNSLAIIIPSDIVKLEQLSENDFAKVIIEPYELPIKSYRCCACNTQFDSDDEEPYCPCCSDNSKIEEINEKK